MSDEDDISTERKKGGDLLPSFPVLSDMSEGEVKRGGGGEEGTNVIERLKNSENHFHVCGNRTRRAGLRDERTRSQVSIQ